MHISKEICKKSEGSDGIKTVVYFIGNPNFTVRRPKKCTISV